MAWTQQLPSGKHRALYRDSTGRTRSAGTYNHKPEAQRRAGAAEVKARRTAWLDPDAHKQRWGRWCEEAWWPSRTVAASTAATDEGRLNKYLKPKWADAPIGAINRQAVKAWRAELIKAGVSNSTINRCVALLSSSLSAAVDAEILDHNPLYKLGTLPEPPPRDRVLTKAEYGRLHAQMPTERDQLILMMLGATGLRWGELAGLHWDRVDLAAEQLAVVEVFSERGGTIKAYPKGKRARIVPLPGWLVDVLKQLPRGEGPCGVAHEVGRCRSSLVLTSPEGAVLRNSNWGPKFRNAVKDAGLPHTKIHDMRAAAASWWLAEMDRSRVQKLLGHVDPKTTDRYALASVDAKRARKAMPDPRKKPKAG